MKISCAVSLCCSSPLLCTSLFISCRANRAYCLYDSHNTIENKSSEKAAVETLLADNEHFYFVDVVDRPLALQPS